MKIIYVLALMAILPNALAQPEYNRDDWPHWIDDDDDCQDLRAEILIQHSTVPVTYTNSEQCVVATGRWTGAYTGNVYTSASDVHIDHLVPLYEAHISGGHAWTQERRRRYANDTRNLRIVDAGLNRNKGAMQPSAWLPPKTRYHCDYIAAWVQTKTLYGLSIDPDEQRAITTIREKCP